MASFEKNSNGKWSVRFRYIEDGISVNKRMRGFDTKKAAERAMLEYIAEHPSSERKIENDYTVGELYAQYLVYIKNRLKESSVAPTRRIIEKYALPYFEDKKVRKIKATDIIDWQHQILSYNLSQRYSRDIYSGFKALLGFGQKYYDLPNVANKVDNFKKTKKSVQMQIWTEEEFKQFISVVDDLAYKAVFSFLYLTGCRKGEALALSWSDVNFDTGIVHIEKQCDFHIKGTSYKIFDIPKNMYSIRDILLPKSLIAVLKELKLTRKAKPNNFVFDGEAPIPAETLRRKFHHYSKIAGVKKIRLHDLRHSHASYLIGQKQDIVTIAHRLGHKDIVQTLNTYAHFMPNKQKELLSVLEMDI